MIRTLSQTAADVPIRTQVAVVGSGPAGVEVATHLAGLGHRVAVLESGGEAFDARANALNDAEFVGRPHRTYHEGADFHEFLPSQYQGMNRVRQLGGTSVIWTGKWRTFEQRDFEPRPWVPLSGWPVAWEDMASAYAEIAQSYDLAFGPDGGPVDDLPDLRVAFHEAGFKTIPYYKQPATYRSADRLRAAAGALDVWLDATVTRIDLAPGADRVEALACRSLDGAERRIEAEHVVLATGALETPRLLLASNHQRPAGLGNEHDLVGRYYQDHLKVNRATIEAGPLLARLAGAVQTHPQPRTLLCIGLPDAEQERLGVLEGSVFIKPLYARRRDKVRALLSGRPLGRDGHGPVRGYSATFAMEQAPNFASRIRLSETRDALGVPGTVVDWQLNDLDRRSFEVTARELARRMAATGLGRFGLGGDPSDLSLAIDSAHHMGTTRMALSPREGVVDPLGTVFGIPNLHVAGSAVFPTGASYSPTFTILALARRLSKRIDSALCRPLAASA